MRNIYVDVRGPHPVLFIGLVSVLLTGAPRDISVVDALTLITTPQYAEVK